MSCSWLSGISVSKAFLSSPENRIVCQACFEAGGSQGVEIKKTISGFPHHCQNEALCLDRVTIVEENGVGHPLDFDMDPHSIQVTRNAIAISLLYGTPRQVKVGRLWMHLFREQLKDRELIMLSSFHPVALYRCLLGGYDPRKKYPVFTDLDNFYGVSSFSEEGMLWKIPILDDGTWGSILAISIPLVEVNERPVLDSVREAISEGAWD